LGKGGRRGAKGPERAGPKPYDRGKPPEIGKNVNDNKPNHQTEKHHSFPKALGGDPKQETTPLKTRDHWDLHKDMNDFLRNRTNYAGDHMRPQRGNPGLLIRNNFTLEQRVNALRDFYDGPGSRYTDAARDFFRQVGGRRR